MIDLGLYRADGGVFATQALADSMDSGRTVVGMEKLAQRFLLELLTPTDEIAQETMGCPFIDRLTTGNFSSESDVFVAFSSAAGLVVSRLKEAETADDPDNERIASVRAVSLTLANGAMRLAIRLTNQAGTASNLTVPLDFLV